MRNIKCDYCDRELLESFSKEPDTYGDGTNLCESCYVKGSTEDVLLERFSKIYFSKLEDNKYFEFDFLNENFSITSSNIRFINPLNEFDFSDFKSYFFIDSQLYVISRSPHYAEFDVRESLKNTMYYKFVKSFGYVIKGLYAGRNTGFKDDENKNIYTGDIVRFLGANSRGRDPFKYFENDRLIPENNEILFECYGVVSYQPAGSEGYMVVLDNHGAFLCHAMELEILGNIFYDLTPNKRVDIWREACSIGIGYNGFGDKRTRDSLKRDMGKIKTPNFLKTPIQDTDTKKGSFISRLFRSKQN